MGFAPRLTLAIATTLTMAAPAFAADDAVKVLQVRESLRGAIAPNASWVDIGPGTEAHAGDTFKTGPASAADMLLPSGARFVMGDSTLVRLQNFDSTVSPRVLTGRVRFVAAPAGTTSLIAGDYLVSGTDGEAIVSREGRLWQVAVLSGRFTVADSSRELASVSAGQVLTASPTMNPQVATLSRSMQQDLETGLAFSSAPARPVAATPSAKPAAVSTVAAAAGANRWVATGLSALLPGAGQLYAGELPRGLTYLGLNGALMGVGYYARSAGQNNLAMAMALGLVGLNVLSPLDAMIFTPEPKEAEKR